MGRLVTRATVSALLQLLREGGGGAFLRQLHSRPTVACCLLRLLTAVVRRGRVQVHPPELAVPLPPAGIGPRDVQGGSERRGVRRADVDWWCLWSKLYGAL